MDTRIHFGAQDDRVTRQDKKVSTDFSQIKIDTNICLENVRQKNWYKVINSLLLPSVFKCLLLYLLSDELTRLC